MDIVKDIFLYDEDKGLVKEKYKNNFTSLKNLAEKVRSDEVAENIDKCIDNVISSILSLKDELKTVENIKKYIKAYLIDTERNNNIKIGFINENEQ